MTPILPGERDSFASSAEERTVGLTGVGPGGGGMDAAVAID